MKLIKILIWTTIPIFLIMLFASLLTTKTYLYASKGLYESHEDIYYDQDYAIDRIMGYLNYEYDDLYFGLNENDDSVIMRDIEIRHMEDVKDLYTMLRIVALSSFIIGASLITYLYKKNKEALYDTLKHLYVAPLLFILFVGGYIVIDFNTAFRVFHELFFTNDDWILYANDVLILLLPTNFWMVSGIIILTLFSLSLFGIHMLNKKIIYKAL
jgi:integral membrane protein (TIGR01906 family)